MRVIKRAVTMQFESVDEICLLERALHIAVAIGNDAVRCEHLTKLERNAGIQTPREAGMMRDLAQEILDSL